MQAATGTQGGEDDHLVAAPAAAAAGDNITEHDWHASVERHLLQLLIGEERHKPAVRRPEWIGGPLCAGDPRARHAAKRAQPQTGGPVLHADEHHLLTVG